VNLFNVKVIALVITGASLASVDGCDQSSLSGPPVLRLGRDECGECGMLISEDRCSSALLIERNGAREHVAFDDIGCMLDYQSRRVSETRVIEAYAHDYSSRQWMRVEAATFVRSTGDVVQTPMGSGIVAFANHTAAVEAQKKLGGEIMNLNDLTEARRKQR